MFEARRFRRSLAEIGCWLVLATASSSALAQDKAPDKAQRAAAREAYDAGTRAFEKGDYVSALDNYVKANGIIPTPQALYWIARSYDKLGRTQEAIDAYSTLLSSPNVSSIGEEKLAMANERLAALRPQPEPAPEPAPAPEPEIDPAPTEPPPPALVEPAPAEPPPPVPSRRDDDPLKPQNNLAELGLFTGPLFVSPHHNLRDNSLPRSEYETLSWLFGLRAAYFPVKVAGIEAEWAHGWGHAKEPSDPSVEFARSNSARFDAFRGHLIGQLATSRFVPFALLGAGILRANSARMGGDIDFLLEAGVGAKFAVTELVTPRLDLRVGMTQKDGGGFTDGIAFHPEATLGLSFTLGRQPRPVQ